MRPLQRRLRTRLKHAFPKGEGGDIRVLLHKVDDKDFELSVSDNGIGLPEVEDRKKSGSLGLTLVRLLTEQLEGSLDISTENGTCYRIRFTQGGDQEHPGGY